MQGRRFPRMVAYLFRPPAAWRKICGYGWSLPACGMMLSAEKPHFSHAAGGRTGPGAACGPRRREADQKKSFGGRGHGGGGPFQRSLSPVKPGLSHAAGGRAGPGAACGPRRREADRKKSFGGRGHGGGDLSRGHLPPQDPASPMPPGDVPVRGRLAGHAAGS